MSNSYDKWSAMSEEELSQAIADRKVTRKYLNWLGVSGAGKQIRNALAKEKS